METDLLGAIKLLGGTLGAVSIKAFVIHRAYMTFIGKPMRETYVHRAVTDIRLDYLEKYANIPDDVAELREEHIQSTYARNK